MSNVFSINFDGLTNGNIGAAPAQFPTGAHLIPASAGHPDEWTTFSSFGGIAAAGPYNGGLVIASVDHPNDNQSGSFEVNPFGTYQSSGEASFAFGDIGVALRMAFGGNYADTDFYSGYLAMVRYKDSTIRIVRYNANTSTPGLVSQDSTLLYSGPLATPLVSGTSRTFTAEVSGTTTVKIDLKEGGVSILPAPVTDSSASRVVVGKKFGGYMRAPTGNPPAMGSMSVDTIASVADTTPPTMTGTMTASGVSSSGYTLSWAGTTRGDNVAIGGYQHSVDGSTWTDSGNVTSRLFTGKAASTLYPNYVRAYDTASPTPNYSTPALLLNVTTAAPSGDTTAPNLSGAITQGAITANSSAISWPAATDNVAVDHYEVSKDGGTNWTVVPVGTLNYTFTGLTASTTYGQRVRALDAANNVSAVLALPVTTSASSATRTWVSNRTFVNVQGSGSNLIAVPMAGVAFTVYINDAAGNLIDSKAGLVTGSDGKPPVWTGSAGNSGTDYRATYVKVSDQSAIAIEIIRAT